MNDEFYLTERSSLPVMARGLVGCTARAHSSPSQWPCMMRKGLLRSWTTTSKISLSCVPTRMWSPRQHTLRTDSPIQDSHKHTTAQAHCENRTNHKHGRRQTFAAFTVIIRHTKAVIYRQNVIIAICRLGWRVVQVMTHVVKAVCNWIWAVQLQSDAWCMCCPHTMLCKCFRAFVDAGFLPIIQYIQQD